MSRKRKMIMGDLYDLRVEWHASQRVTNPVTGNRATRFILSKPLTAGQKNTVLSYANTVYVEKGASYRYAPEISYPTVVLYDKCIRK